MKFIKKQVIQEKVEEIKEEPSNVEEIKQENLTEAVDKNRSYDYDSVSQVIAKVLEQHGYNVVDDLDTETDLSQKIINYNDIEEEFRWVNTGGSEIQAEDVDNGVEKIARYFKLVPEEVKVIEDAINKSFGNAAGDRKEEFYDDLNTLENLLDEDSQIRLFSPKVKEELGKLIYKLKHSNYNGLDKE